VFKPTAHSVIACFGVAAFMTASAPPASADPTTTLSYEQELRGGFNIGSGNNSDQFAVAEIFGTQDDIELGALGKERFFGGTNVPTVDGQYFVQPGFSPVSGSDPTPDPNRAWWNFDVSYDFGNKTLSDYDAFFSIMDPDGDLYSTQLSDTLAGGQSVIQFSWNTGFGFLEFGAGSSTGGLGPMDAFMTGDYDISLLVTENGTGSTGPVIGELDITVTVVPSPAAFGASLIGLGLLAGRRRRA
jgi:hypothetical protein